METISTPRILIRPCSDLNGLAAAYELQNLVGRRLKRIESSEYDLTLIFEDDSYITAHGARWGDCALGVDYRVAPSEGTEAGTK